MIEDEDDRRSVISGNEARAGVTGHHVRYVLAFGLAGAIAAYVILGLYYYYDPLTAAIAQIRIDPGALVSYVVPIALAGVTVVLLLGLWNMTRPNASQAFMRWRVVLQFIALMLIMAALYLSGRS
jgi:NADH:ubiquinone oxidoreductase subunit H